MLLMLTRSRRSRALGLLGMPYLGRIASLQLISDVSWLARPSSLPPGGLLASHRRWSTWLTDGA